MFNHSEFFSKLGRKVVYRYEVVDALESLLLSRVASTLVQLCLAASLDFLVHSVMV